MKEHEKLERSIFWSECVHLALLTLCFSIPIALIFDADEQHITHLPWAFGAVIPVQLIRMLCQRIEKKGLRFLASVAVIGLTVLLMHREHSWIGFLVPMLLILFSGVFLPRHKGKLIFTIPSPFTLGLTLIAYVISKKLSVPLLGSFSVILAALLTLNFLIHTNLVRLREYIRLSIDGEIGLSGIIRQNYRLIAVYALIGILVIGATPFLLQREQRPIWQRVVELVPETEPVATDNVIQEYEHLNTAVPQNAELVADIVLTILLVVFILALLALLFLLGKSLLERIDRKKLPPPKLWDGILIEQLEEEAAKTQREKLSGWEKKIRRRYEKLILRLTRVDASLLTLTPAELEAVAGISGKPENAELHAIYEQTRYSAEPPTREDYARFKTLSKTLESVAAERNLPK